MVERFGAKTEYVNDPSKAHNMADDVPAQAIRFIYGNLANSGVNLNDELKSKDSAYLQKGVLSSFDQTPFIQSAVEEHSRVEGGSANVDHRLGDTGYIYVPEFCKDGKNSCKLAIVSHGAGGKASHFAQVFGPHAPNYDIVMVFP